MLLAFSHGKKKVSGWSWKWAFY